MEKLTGENTNVTTRGAEKRWADYSEQYVHNLLFNLHNLISALNSIIENTIDYDHEFETEQAKLRKKFATKSHKNKLAEQGDRYNEQVCKYLEQIKKYHGDEKKHILDYHMHPTFDIIKKCKLVTEYLVHKQIHPFFGLNEYLYLLETIVHVLLKLVPPFCLPSIYNICDCQYDKEDIETSKILENMTIQLINIIDKFCVEKVLDYCFEHDHIKHYERLFALQEAYTSQIDPIMTETDISFFDKIQIDRSHSNESR